LADLFIYFTLAFRLFSATKLHHDYRLGLFNHSSGTQRCQAYNTKQAQKTKARFGRFYDLRPGNRELGEGPILYLPAHTGAG